MVTTFAYSVGEAVLILKLPSVFHGLTGKVIELDNAVDWYKVEFQGVGAFNERVDGETCWFKRGELVLAL
jgi:hypothetical protein